MKKLILAAVFCSFATGAFADTAGFQLSITPDVAIQPKATRIEGVALNIWGENPQKALALGFVNGSTGASSGLSLGNYASGGFSGVQWAAVNYAGTLNGIQLGMLNIAETTQQGVQIGLFNIIKANKEWFTNLPHEVAPGMIFVNWRL